MQISRLNLVMREHPKALAAFAGAFIVAAAFYHRKCSSADQEGDEASGRAKSSVVVLGDVFVDLMVQSDALPVWDSDTVTTTPISALAGGSGLNTATHLSASFRVPTSMWSAIGSKKDDAWSTLLRAHAARAKFQLCGALNCTATGVCMVLTGKRDRAFITHRGPIGDLHLIETAPTTSTTPHSSSTNSEAKDKCEPGIDVHALLENLAPGGHLHIAGYYNCPRLWGAPMANLLRRAKQLGCTTSLNSQFDASGEWGHMSELLPHLDVLLASRSEAMAIAKESLASSESSNDSSSAGNDSHSTNAGCSSPSSSENTDGQAERAAQWFVDGGCGMAVITLGSRGALAVFAADSLRDGAREGSTSSSSSMNTSARMKVVYQAARSNVSVVDSTGAGDAFNAGFIAGWRGFAPGSSGVDASGHHSSRRAGNGSSGSVTPSTREAAIECGLWWGVAAGAACVGRFGASEPLLRSAIEACAPVALT